MMSYSIFANRKTKTFIALYNKPTPKALQYFMIELIRKIHNCASNVEEPFIAIDENVLRWFLRHIMGIFMKIRWVWTKNHCFSVSQG
jgi:hypothetical protein